MGRSAAVLVDDDVREPVGDEHVAGSRVQLEGDLVRHRGRREEERRLLAEKGRRTLLQGRHRGILATLLVADVGGGDRSAHPVRRARRGVGAQVDHGDHPIPHDTAGASGYADRCPPEHRGGAAR